MGICDLIPGISGGTIALITGIYSRLIKSVKNLFSYPAALTIKHIVFSSYRKSKQVKFSYLAADIKFLLILFLGVGFSIVTFSRVIRFLLDNYLVYTISFFIGLILASSKLIFKDIEKDGLRDAIFGLLGLILGGLFVILNPSNAEPTLFYLFLGGFCAVNAMFLPGISGAFILLILGLYDFMINVLNDILGNLSSFFVFIMGALLGAFTISRVVTFLLKNQKNKTMYFLFGLVFGSLGVPIRTIIEAEPNLDYLNILLVVSFFILGSLILAIFDFVAQRY